MNVRDLALAAKRGGHTLAALSEDRRAELLRSVARSLEDAAWRERLFAANARDLEAARAALAAGTLAAPLVRRLELAPGKLESLAQGLRQLADAPQAVGRVRLRRELADGLVLSNVTSPLGLLGVVFESRPDAVPQIAGLAIKSGNAVLLKGGREAQASNAALVELLHEALARHGVPTQAISLLPDRAAFGAMLELDDLVDLIVARGSSRFVQHVMASTKIPVMGHAAGLCHVLLHAPVDPAMATHIVEDAKCGYPAACNAVETLLWTPGAEAALGVCLARLQARGVELRGGPATRALHPDMAPATQADWDTEYGDLVLSVRCVDDLDAALEHIERHGSGHTEAIVTDDAAAAERFLARVDAAGVFHNASTRFADGYRYGLGAEVGIGTGKLHARGPVGVDGLLTERWLLRGTGQAAADFGPGGRSFTHRDLEP